MNMKKLGEVLKSLSEVLGEEEAKHFPLNLKFIVNGRTLKSYNLSYKDRESINDILTGAGITVPPMSKITLDEIPVALAYRLVPGDPKIVRNMVIKPNHNRLDEMFEAAVNSFYLEPGVADAKDVTQPAAEKVAPAEKKVKPVKPRVIDLGMEKIINNGSRRVTLVSYKSVADKLTEIMSSDNDAWLSQNEMVKALSAKGVFNSQTNLKQKKIVLSKAISRFMLGKLVRRGLSRKNFTYRLLKEGK